MDYQALTHILRHADVIAAVRAAEDVDEVHRCYPFLDRNDNR